MKSIKSTSAKRSSIFHVFFAVGSIIVLLLSAWSPPRPVAASPSAQADGVRYGYSDATGKLTFVGADPSRPVDVAGVSGVSALSAEDQALGIIDQYADALGLSNPSQELRLAKVESFENRTMLRYQQVYQGIPVMGGDLILNTQGEGYLLSLSGEVSPNLEMDTATQLTAEQASAIALQAMQKWYPGEQASFTTSEPEPWIYDPRLLEDRDGPIVLGWRMDVTSEGISLPIRELVLVDASTGNVPLHFNQIDTGWNGQMQDPAPTETPLPTDTLEPTTTPVPPETPIPTEIPTAVPLEPADVGALVATPRYVSTTGTDSGNCTNSGAPCLTMNYAIGQAVAGDPIYVAAGSYTGAGGQVVLIAKSLTLSGGWDASFTIQGGYSTIDGQNARRGVNVQSGSGTVGLDHFVVQNGSTAFVDFGGGIFNGTNNLNLSNTTITSNSGMAGGGVANFGNLALDNSAVSNNFASQEGGGIWNGSATSLTINDSTITNNSANSSGGGIFGGTAIALQNTTVLSNLAARGGGIYNYGSLDMVNTSTGNNSALNDGGGIFNAGTLIANSSTVSGNTASSTGGGIYNYGGTLTLNNSTVSENTSSSGGGIFNHGATLTLNNSTVSANTSGYGGGIYNYYGTLTLSNSTVSGNTASLSGGGIYVDLPTLTLNNSTLSNNRAGQSGGAIYNASGTAMLNGTTLSGNNAGAEGGGIYQASGALTIANSTISGNLGETGGGLYLNAGTANLNNTTITQNAVTSAETYALGGGIYIANGAALNLGNSVIAGNDADYDEDCSGAVTSGGHNLIGYGPGCSLSPASGDLIGSQGSPINAKLGILKNNGGATFTHALLAGSPAIDAGDPATCASTDQRGVVRPVGAACDIGAFEGSGAQTVTASVRTYTAGNQGYLPGTLLCDQPAPSCTSGADVHADKAHKYAIGTYNLYRNKHGRTGIDDNNMPVISTVHYGSGYPNAFWSGAQMVYGDGYGFPNADDVVAHELTHGVTEYESNLFYFYESGAINESLSDVWGEYYDQTNGLGNDASTVKWKIGEDVTGLGAIRSMSDPPAYGDPDKMTSSLYNKKPYWDNNWDNGGVHSNSGVNNKAAFLLVQGGTFNGKTVSALGWDKTAAIYYEVQTHLLASGAGYADLYNALYQGCLNLADAGTNGITTPNCQAVRDATNAVQMNVEPSSGYNPDAALCPSGQSTGPAVTLFQDTFENGTANWSETGAGQWYLGDFYASSPTHMMWGDDTNTGSDSRLVKKTGVALPAGSKYYLHFKHAYAFEYVSQSGVNYYFDGGRLEYSTNNGGTWADAGPLFSAGANYKGTILNYPGTTNALKGKQGFVGDSHGYVSSRYTLQSLAGQTVKFRWRFATDQDFYFWGWFVDDVKIYRCVGTPSKPTLQSPANGALVTDYTPLLNWSDSTPNLDHYQLQVATNSTFTSLLYNQTSLATSQYTIPANLAAAQTLYWRVRAYNVLGQTKGWSSVFSFRTALPKPVLVSPAEGAAVLSLRPTFDWGDVTGASGYTIQIATSSSFSSVLVTGNPTVSTFRPGTNLPAGATLYWRVRSTGSYGPSAWSAVRSFHTP